VKGKTVEGYVLRDAPGWTWKANGRDNEGRYDFLVIEHLAYGAARRCISIPRLLSARLPNPAT